MKIQWCLVKIKKIITNFNIYIIFIVIMLQFCRLILHHLRMRQFSPIILAILIILKLIIEKNADSDAIEFSYCVIYTSTHGILHRYAYIPIYNSKSFGIVQLLYFGTKLSSSETY